MRLEICLGQNKILMSYQNHSEYKQKGMKEDFFHTNLAPALAEIVKMMRQNETMFLVGNKVEYFSI